MFTGSDFVYYAVDSSESMMTGYFFSTIPSDNNGGVPKLWVKKLVQVDLDCTLEDGSIYSLFRNVEEGCYVSYFRDKDCTEPDGSRPFNGVYLGSKGSPCFGNKECFVDDEGRNNNSLPLLPALQYGR